MEEIIKKYKEIKDKLGITAFEEVCKFHYTLIRKIEDLTKSRNKWREKYEEFKRNSRGQS